MNPTERPVRFSFLKKLDLSPQHYLAALADDAPASPSMHIGKLAHALVLGGDYVVFEGERRGNKWKDFKEANDGKMIVTESELGTAYSIADALAKHADAPRLLKGTRELELDWTMLGRRCQSHLDVLGNTFITDLKTASLTKPEKFIRDALWYKYHAQLAFYQDAVAYNFAGKPVDAFIVAVETAAPFAVVAFELTPRALDEGRKLNRLWMERLIACEQANEWPGYAQSVLALDVPDDTELTYGEDAA